MRMLGNRLHHTAPVTPATGDPFEIAARRYARRVRRLKVNVAAWALGSALLTGLWVAREWQDNGAFRHFGNEGNAGDWNPTLWALAVGVWTLVVGLMALHVRFVRPTTVAEVDREIERLTAPGETRRSTLARLERIRRLKFHVAAWVLGMIVSTPLWALIEWQDNGPFERWSTDSQPGSWDPWILPVGGVWALVVAIFGLRVYLGRSPAGANPKQ